MEEKLFISGETKGLNETKAELTGLYQKIQLIAKKLKGVAEKKNRTDSSAPRPKRQLAFGGGFGMGFGAYDYNDYYGEYVSDYAYDYYDWICSDTSCQLCDILTSECCDPAIDVNCFLPDSCLNNPCLSGGTCITTKTLDQQPDFICVCLPGLTGKYCQLVNDYFVGAEIAFAPAVAAIGAGAVIPTSAAKKTPASAVSASAKTVATKQQVASPVQIAKVQPDVNAQFQEQLQEYHNLVAKQQQQQSQNLAMTGNG